MPQNITAIEQIFNALATMNQNDFIDWLLANKNKLLNND